MIYVIMAGRLGNQLFQYSYAKKVQMLTGQKLALDFTAVNNVGNPNWKNNLVDYNISNYIEVKRKDYYPYQRFIYRILKIVRTRLNKRQQYKFDMFTMRYFSRIGVCFCESDYKAIIPDKIGGKNIIIRGWFESEKYFADILPILRKEFVPNKEISAEGKIIEKKLKYSEAICITIRRGNFTEEKNQKKFLVCTQNYYISGANYILTRRKNAILYICSDDIEWCKRNLQFDAPVIYENEKPAWEKLYLMTLCKHFVISNSSFSWWAQCLSDNLNKIVVAPSVWRNDILSPKDIYCRGWIRINERGDVINVIED